MPLTTMTISSMTLNNNMKHNDNQHNCMQHKDTHLNSMEHIDNQHNDSKTYLHSEQSYTQHNYIRDDDTFNNGTHLA